MKFSQINKSITSPYLAIIWFFVSLLNIDAQNVFPKDAWGVYTWGAYNPKIINPIKTPEVKGVPTILKWADLEPENGKFEFDKLIKNKLEKLDKDNYYTTLMVWVAFSTTKVTSKDTIWAFTPPWLFKNGVPLVEFPPTVNPLGKTLTRYFPYYLDETYKFYFHRMLKELGYYILNLPEHLRKRILFVQSAEGSTGDGQPYRGHPLDPKYNISKSEWSDYRIETWKILVKAFSEEGDLQIPLLTNYDSNEDKEYNWMLTNLPKAIGIKNGMFSHGYHISNAQQRLANFVNLRKEVKEQGKVFFARGEQDAEYKTYGWSKNNIPQGLYWSALYASHCGLSMWNIPWEACTQEENFPAFELFNRYAAQTDAVTARFAFCALRSGLDASDTTKFPENLYGKAIKSNQQRYINITKAYSKYGAEMADPEKASGSGMLNRKRQGYNDAGWQILPGNYERHLSQIDSEETSVGWWNMDKSIYGRFARGFDYKNYKNAMYFDDNFFGKNTFNRKSGVKVKIIYYQGDKGSWELLYHAYDGSMKSAMTVKNTGENTWAEKTITLNDALLNNGGEKGADLILKNKELTNCRFHMIEIKKTN
jgi:hypothetical protein